MGHLSSVRPSKGVDIHAMWQWHLGVSTRITGHSFVWHIDRFAYGNTREGWKFLHVTYISRARMRGFLFRWFTSFERIPVQCGRFWYWQPDTFYGYQNKKKNLKTGRVGVIERILGSDLDWTP
jgi:Cu2+-containing amine oxidase